MQTMRAPAAPSRPAIAAGVATKRGLINANVARRVSVRGASTDDKNGVAPSQIPSMYNLFGGPAKDKEFGNSLEDRIASGEFSDNGSTKEKLTRPIRKILAQDPIGAGRWLALQLAQVGKQWQKDARKKMPAATGDLRELIGKPVFVPLFTLFQAYGKIFRLSFGPKSFVVVSDPAVARQILRDNAENYSKGLLSEILDFVMGTGLIPADGETWKVRRRAVVPALHKKYVASMVNMFADCTVHGTATLNKAHAEGKPVELENFFSRLALDIIGKAVFNYDFDSLTTDDPVIQAVYTTLREAEYRSLVPLPYWRLPGAMSLVPRQRRCVEALQVINATLDQLIAKCKKLVEEEDEEFVEEFLSKADPSILHYLIASGDDITSKQLRDDLMTLLIAGHETTAAVLTWTFHILASHPDAVAKIRAEVDAVLGDRSPTVEDMRNLRYTTRVINESMRLYPQPPVLIRRALSEDTFGQYPVDKGSDIFISIWNLHHSPELWDEPEAFKPERFGPLDGSVPNEITNNFAYLPFGGGRRKCVGDQFALFEATVALAMLVRRFDFTMAPDAPEVGMTTGATIHTTKGLWMNVAPRSAAPPDPSPEAAAAWIAATYGAPAAASTIGAAAGGCPFHAPGHAALAANGNGHHAEGAAAASGGGCPFHAAAVAGGDAAAAAANGNGHHAAAANGHGANGMNGHHDAHAAGANGNGNSAAVKLAEKETVTVR